jgi:hypothetical protein
MSTIIFHGGGQVDSENAPEIGPNMSAGHADPLHAWISERHMRVEAQVELKNALAERDGVILLLNNLICEIDSMKRNYDTLIEIASESRKFRGSFESLEISFKQIAFLAYNSAQDILSKAAIMEVCRRHRFQPDRCVALLGISGLPRLRVFPDKESSVLLAIHDNKSTPLWVSEPISVTQSAGDPCLWETASNAPIAHLPVSLLCESAPTKLSVIYDDVSIAETVFSSKSMILQQTTLQFFHNGVELPGCVGHVGSEIIYPDNSTRRISFQIIAISGVELEIDQSLCDKNHDWRMKIVFQSGLDTLSQSTALSYEDIQGGERTTSLECPDDQNEYPIKISMVYGPITVACATIVVPLRDAKSGGNLEMEIPFRSSGEVMSGCMTLAITTTDIFTSDKAASRSG